MHQTDQQCGAGVKKALMCDGCLFVTEEDEGDRG